MPLAVGLWASLIAFLLMNIQWNKMEKEKKPKWRNSMVFWASLSLHGMARGDFSCALLFVCDYCLAGGHLVSRNGWEANCFLCPLMTRQCVSFCICISFCLSPKSSSFHRNQHCLVLETFTESVWPDEIFHKRLMK